jgi:hypothetical protein
MRSWFVSELSTVYVKETDPCDGGITLIIEYSSPNATAYRVAQKPMTRGTMGSHNVRYFLTAAYVTNVYVNAAARTAECSAYTLGLVAARAQKASSSPNRTRWAVGSLRGQSANHPWDQIYVEA